MRPAAKKCFIIWDPKYLEVVIAMQNNIKIKQRIRMGQPLVGFISSRGGRIIVVIVLISLYYELFPVVNDGETNISYTPELVDNENNSLFVLTNSDSGVLNNQRENNDEESRVHEPVHNKEFVRDELADSKNGTMTNEKDESEGASRGNEIGYKLSNISNGTEAADQSERHKSLLAGDEVGGKPYKTGSIITTNRPNKTIDDKLEVINSTTKENEDNGVVLPVDIAPPVNSTVQLNSTDDSHYPIYTSSATKENKDNGVVLPVDIAPPVNSTVQLKSTDDSLYPFYATGCCGVGHRLGRIVPLIVYANRYGRKVRIMWLGIPWSTLFNDTDFAAEGDNGGFSKAKEKKLVWYNDYSDEWFSGEKEKHKRTDTVFDRYDIEAFYSPSYAAVVMSMRDSLSPLVLSYLNPIRAQLNIASKDKNHVSICTHIRQGNNETGDWEEKPWRHIDINAVLNGTRSMMKSFFSFSECN